MKKLTKLVPLSVLLVFSLGMFLPSIMTAAELMVAGREIHQRDFSASPGSPLSSDGEIPCDGSRIELETANYYGYLGGPGTGRAFGFHADETFSITSVGIKGDLLFDDYDLVIYDSVDGSIVGSELYSTTTATGGTGYGWNDMAAVFTFSAGNYYIVNWRPSDCNNTWANGLDYYNDSGLPHDFGPLTVVDGIEGCDATSPTNFLHCFFRICIEGGGLPWDICMKDVNYTPEIWVSLAGGGVLHGQAILEGSPSFPAPVTGYIDPPKVYFTIAYLESNGVRFYEIDLSDNRDGTTWGIYNDTGKFYDLQHSAHLDPCGPGIAIESGIAVE